MGFVERRSLDTNREEQKEEKGIIEDRDKDPVAFLRSRKHGNLFRNMTLQHSSPTQFKRGENQEYGDPPEVLIVREDRLQHDSDRNRDPASIEQYFDLLDLLGREYGAAGWEKLFVDIVSMDVLLETVT